MLLNYGHMLRMLGMQKSNHSPSKYNSSTAQTRGFKKSGVTEDLIRLSVGIAHIDDFLEDLE